MSMTIKHWLAALLAAVLATLTTPSFADETITYIHWDALGSPVAATDESGNVVWREGYRPYGERIDNEAAGSSNSRWYTGHPQDDDTGLVYAGARYYDPVVGRFLARDPVTFQEDNLHSFNRYAHANNNPYSYIDPDGREGVGAAFVMQDGDRFTGAFGTSGSVEEGTQQISTIIETVDNISSVVMPAKGAVTFVGKQAGKFIKKSVTKGTGKAASKSDDVIHVTKDGVALPPGSKHKIPESYVQNPHRPGSYGEIVDSRFKERLRIDPPTPPGQKGPNYSHYHKNGKGTHYSPRPGDKDPGF